ncbi:MAG: SprT-like domain-containing protein [Methanosarcinaceae archaeon]
MPNYNRAAGYSNKNKEHVVMKNKKLPVEVIRSHKRKKTVQAKLMDGKLRIYLPAGLSKKRESELIEKMRARIEKKRLERELNDDDYLKTRFNEFNKRFFKGELQISSIKFVTNHNACNGSCTPAKGTIRISHRLANMPKWVLDYLIMHEMAHLLHPDHSKRFWDKVNEYRYTERARGFLICKGMEKID